MRCRTLLRTAGILALAAHLFAAPAGEKAPEFRSSDIRINSDGPFKLSSFKGKVVVVDFWAFDCAPCKVTMPYIEELYERYAKDDLVVIGVHTPRADYEKDIPRLREAVKTMGIRFPVVVDTKQKIWSDYRCDIWPTLFVIDRTGLIRLNHGGVGRYEEIEKAIQTALREK